VEQSITFFEKKAAASNADGSAYGRGQPSFDEELVRVGPGTPCGEFMRRYWQPVAVSSKLTTRPQALRVLGEDLVLFRDGQGRAGLLAARCAHRGTSLYYGKVDDAGIRCCYHGWQFDVEGRCLDQPCEPERGRHKDRVRQPWYPVEERYGLVFAYMGPPQKKPVLPRWDVLEHLGADEKVFASGPSGFGAGGDDSVSIIPCSWLQQYENTVDPFHLTVLHTNHSGVQFCADLAAMPTVKFEYTDLGVRYVATVPRLSDGKAVDRVAPAVFPNIRSAPSVHLDLGPSKSMVWSVPVDDAQHMIFQALRVPSGFSGVADDFRATRPVRFSDDAPERPPTRPKLWSELTEEQRQRFPSDWEAQMSQGPITHHSEENLATSDVGIVMLRRLLRQQIRLVLQGGDPIGVSFDEGQGVLPVGGGNVLGG
jgi:phenylpropionate dioxygenase-like ring-hydroxylating dioxygenase large terminal subunit